MSRHGIVLVAALAMTHAGVSAIVVAGPGGVAEQGRRTAIAAPVSSGDTQTLELVNAVIETVSIERSQIVVSGREVGLHPNVRIFRGGQAAGPAALHAGQHVRFALESRKARAGEARRIVLIQIER